MRSAHALVVGVLLALGVPGLSAQTKPSSQTGAKPVAPAVKPSATPAKPAAQAAAPAKAAAQASAKPTAAAPKSPVTKAARVNKKPAAKKASKPVETQADTSVGSAENEAKLARRDPFESLIGRQQRQAQAGPMIPGIPGLVIGTLRLDGIVRAPNGMIAVVTNPQQRTYFLREGDQLFDGRVEKITMDSVSFHELGKDAFGKPVERTVSKGIYSSPGEQQ